MPFNINNVLVRDDEIKIINQSINQSEEREEYSPILWYPGYGFPSRPTIVTCIIMHKYHNT